MQLIKVGVVWNVSRSSWGRPAKLASARTRVCALTLVVLAGCSKSPYELAPVDGVVTIDGTPIHDAKVMFAPIAQGENRNSGKPAFGTLEPDGSFKLTTYRDNDGAVVGEHWVTIFRLDPETPNGGGASPKAPHLPFDRLAVPKKVSVTAGQQNHIAITLTGVEVIRFGRLTN